jgi:HEAT repeat protein
MDSAFMDKTGYTTLNLKNLLVMLASKDSTTRKEARELLVTLGKPAVSSLSILLQNSKDDHLRWEAAKTLGCIEDTSSIPSLVNALEDRNHDVAWLAAEALSNFEKAAWPALLELLVKTEHKDSILLRQGAHHVLLNQKEDGFDDLLEYLQVALKSNAAPELTVIAANELLKRMNIKIQTDN